MVAVVKEGRTAVNSNTTLVKVKCGTKSQFVKHFSYSNTTLVKVKYRDAIELIDMYNIQIQLLLKLNYNTLHLVF